MNIEISIQQHENMPYSIEVHFDDITNAAIQEMWNVLSQNNIPCRALE